MKTGAMNWLSTVIGKKKTYIAFLLLLQAVLGESSVLYALLLRNVIDCAAEKNSHGFVCFLSGILFLPDCFLSFTEKIQSYRCTSHPTAL